MAFDSRKLQSQYKYSLHNWLQDKLFTCFFSGSSLISTVVWLWSDFGSGLDCFSGWVTLLLSLMSVLLFLESHWSSKLFWVKGSFESTPDSWFSFRFPTLDGLLTPFKYFLLLVAFTTFLTLFQFFFFCLLISVGFSDPFPSSLVSWKSLSVYSHAWVSWRNIKWSICSHTEVSPSIFECGCPVHATILNPNYLSNPLWLLTAKCFRHSTCRPCNHYSL